MGGTSGHMDTHEADVVSILISRDAIAALRANALF